MRKRTPFLLFLWVAASLVLVSCSDDDSTQPMTSDRFDELIEEFGLAPLGTPPYPEGNRFNPERIALGQLLFFDPILGGESAPWIKVAAGRDPYRFRANDVACATCHFPTLGFADGRRLGAGVGGAQFNDLDLGPQRVVPGPSLVTGNPVGAEPRNSPTVLNASFNGRNSHAPVAESFQFMDGRVTKGLEQQATLPITSRDEMAGDAYGDLASMPQSAPQDSVAARIRNIPEYVDRFKQAFAEEIDEASDITIDHVARAIAAFERELITPNSPYDRFLKGSRNALDDIEKDGFELFFTKGLCGDCHNGPMLSDYTHVVQGVGDGYEQILPGFPGKNGEGSDWGRFHADPEAFAAEKFAFRTLTVRNVEVTGPYFHSGSAGTLRDVVEFYNRGGLGEEDIPDEVLDAVSAVRHPSIRELGLTEYEKEAIVAFMKTTTAPVQPGPSGMDLTAVPQRVPSGLLPPGVPTPRGKPGPFLPGDADLK